MRACIITTIESQLGPLSLASLHLTPYSEDLRHPEIDLITNFQKKYKNRILMGDMNSLSKLDGYNPEIIKSFNEMQIKKFTTNGKFRFDAIEKIMSVEYFDSAVEMKQNKEYTAPTTSINEYAAHSNMRLDYIFLSKPLLSHLKSYRVIKNDLTNKASDHYPVIIELN